MKVLQTTLLVILASILSIQAVRHLHLYAFGYQESVLAPYEEFFRMTEEVRLEASTEELEADYERTQEAIRVLRDNAPDKNAVELQRENGELFAHGRALARELRERQEMSRDLRDVWQFSLAGYVLIAAGVLLYARNREWLGMSLLVPGFVELAWWSSPAFTMGGAVREYELLLVSKIGLTAIALVLLYALWLLAERRRKPLRNLAGKRPARKVEPKSTRPKAA